MTNSMRGLLRLLLALGYAAGAVLVLLLLFKDDPGGVAERTGYTALAVLLLLFTASAGLRLSRRPTLIALFGAATALVSVATFVLLMVEVWPDEQFREGERTLVMIVISLLLGAASLLLDGERSGDGQEVRLTRGAAVLALLAVAVLAILEVADVDISERVAMVASAVFVVTALSLPLVRLAFDADGGGSGLALDHAVIAVSDPDRSARFYKEVLGARIETDAEGQVAYRIGEQKLNVHRPGADATPLAAVAVSPGSSDLCFVWPRRGQDAVAHLRKKGVEIVEGPVIRRGSRGLGVSVYCRDPDGSLIELISYR